ncbi:protein disulfide-isomerase A4 isoform 2-T2 [Anomaloglossus baeobatrachus]|uniref:protein disulfide-isomerase A4 isoform X2 n=1 Tax=Anomaloglossus baeobatrachus TaxID=238106 RepID=UPI003F4FAD86
MGCESVLRALLVLALLPIAWCEESGAETSLEETDVKEENGVFILNDANFDTFVTAKDTVLVEFYAPWCGHCKQFAPEYEKIAETLKKNDPAIPVAKVDATEATKLANKYDINGYPTIKILKKGQPIDYDGLRTEKAIVAKIKEVSDPNWTIPPEATMVLTEANFNEVVEAADIILVEFYAPWCGHCKRFAPEYEKAAQELRKHTPAIPLAKVDATTEVKLAKRYNVSGYPTLKIFRKGKSYDYNGPRENYGIIDFMIEQAGPPSTLIQNVKQVQEYLRDASDAIVIGVFIGNKQKEFQLHQDAANALREDFKFYHTFSSDVASFLKVNTGQLVVMQPDRFQSKYEPRKHLFNIKDLTSEEDLKEHVVNHALPLVGQRTRANEAKRYNKHPLVVVYYTVDFSFDHRTGKLTPVIKSQPMPKNNKGPVKLVVGKTFEEIVMDTSSDVLIEFYAPWCGHCKSLEPVYNDLGKKYRLVPDLIIAKMDATANDIPTNNYKVEGFPTIYFALKNRKYNPIKFEGHDRDLEGLSKFIEEHRAKSKTKEEL